MASPRQLRVEGLLPFDYDRHVSAVLEVSTKPMQWLMHVLMLPEQDLPNGILYTQPHKDICWSFCFLQESHDKHILTIWRSSVLESACLYYAGVQETALRCHSNAEWCTTMYYSSFEPEWFQEWKPSKFEKSKCLRLCANCSFWLNMCIYKSVLKEIQWNALYIFWYILPVYLFIYHLFIIISPSALLHYQWTIYVILSHRKLGLSIANRKPSMIHVGLPWPIASTVGGRRKTSSYDIMAIACYILPGTNNWTQTTTDWWFQPIWKIWVKLDHFPNYRVKHQKKVETTT